MQAFIRAGAAEFSNPLYDTSYPAEDGRPQYASGYDSTGVIANAAYSDPTAYMEPATSGPGGYTEPEFVGTSTVVRNDKSGEYQDFSDS